MNNKRKRSLNFELKSCLRHWLTSPFKPVCRGSTSELQPAAFPSLNTFKNKWVNMKLISWKIGAPGLCTHTRLWEKWFDCICMGEKKSPAYIIPPPAGTDFWSCCSISTTSLVRRYCLTSSWLENCLFLLIVMAQLLADVFIMHSKLEETPLLFPFRRKEAEENVATWERRNLFLATVKQLSENKKI